MHVSRMCRCPSAKAGVQGGRTSLALGPRFCGGIKKGAEASMLASKRGMSELVNALPLTIKADEERFA